jgi:hypothetical protein
MGGQVGRWVVGWGVDAVRWVQKKIPTFFVWKSRA